MTAIFFSASCQQTGNSKKSESDAAHIATPVTKDPVTIHMQPPIDGISRPDMQYLDLMIPEDAMVEIYYNGDPSELAYIEALKNYLQAKHNTISVFKTNDFPPDVKPAGRLYIHDTGDHRYVMYIF